MNQRISRHLNVMFRDATLGEGHKGKTPSSKYKLKFINRKESEDIFTLYVCDLEFSHSTLFNGMQEERKTCNKNEDTNKQSRQNTLK